MKRLMVGLIVGLALLCGTVGVLVLNQAPQGSVGQTGKAFTPSLAPRLVFPYSLVPGGVHSVAELRKAFKDNPEYAAMFPGFDFTKAHLVHIKQWAWVNFRKNDKVGWAKEPVLLDEDIISDGRYMIRLRCANKISTTPQVPVDPSVTDEVLNTPELPPVDVPPATTEVTVQPVETPTGGSTPSGGGSIGGMGGGTSFGGGGVPPRTPVNVPEPSEWCLAFVALNAILFTQFFKRRK
jgi:uncharacterized membrane protein YgcG